MATLRNFQNEIEGIHQREIAKQRSSASKESEKENKHPSSTGSSKGHSEKKSLPSTQDDLDLESELQVRPEQRSIMDR